MREELHTRLEARLAQMAGTDETLDELSALDLDEQLRIFHEAIAPADEQEERSFALRFVRDRYAEAFAAVENDDWLRIDRIGMRLLGTDGLAPVEWLYLKMALTGLGNPDAEYVMIDEVQDYTAAQLAVLARYFRRAHFLLLGDPNQAIAAGTATFDEVRAVFEAAHGPVEECRLMTSYRSTPEITELFASLLDDEERASISSIQRADTPPTILSCPDETSYATALREAVDAAHAGDGLAAVIVPWKHEAKRSRSCSATVRPRSWTTRPRCRRTASCSSRSSWRRASSSTGSSCRTRPHASSPPATRSHAAACTPRFHAPHAN